MRFIFVDRIADLAPGRSIRTIKSVSASEDYFVDHFPGVPIMPGALILECFIQSAMLMFGAADDFGSRPMVSRVRRASFKRFVRPGDQLMVRCDADDRWVVQASATVEGQELATAVIEFGRGSALPAENGLHSLYDVLRRDPNELAGGRSDA